ncbi:hypothetical protein [uncultured Lacinutrix sp.]|uniref:hypothetical protein n=1 Tax=uncultured Lacinutrix sp. TaxID=574032 RepID=UPI00261D3FF6|nr:hypothetical protein [uncultured Lacinutrix sp.]
MKPQLEKLTNQLYNTFSKYSIKGDLRDRSCDCCVTDEEIRVLLSKPLKDLNDDDIGHFSRSAISTFGHVEDFKHFLPRILELMQDPNSDTLDDFTTFEKLNYSEWETWDRNEIITIDNYLLKLWEDVITNENATFHQIGCVLNIVSKYTGLNKALSIWKNKESSNSTLFIAESIVNGLQYYISKEIISDLTYWFYKDIILFRIEKEFFNTKDEDLASTLSIAHSIIENKYI